MLTIIWFNTCHLFIALICTYIFLVDEDFILYSQIASNCPNLTEISGRSIDTHGLIAFGASGIHSELRHIYFKLFKSTTNTAIDNDHTIEIFARGCPNLTNFCISADEHRVSVTDASVLSLTTYCPHITHLSLRGWNNITDTSLLYLSTLSSLLELDISYCYDLTSINIQAFLLTTPKLRSLIFCEVSEKRYDTESYIDNALLLTMSVSCPDLTRLNFTIDNSVNVTDECLCEMVRGCVLLQELSIGAIKLYIYDVYVRVPVAPEYLYRI